MLIALANEDQTYVTLVTAAFKAGRDERAEAMIELAKNNIAPGKDRNQMVQVFVRLRKQRERTLERAAAERAASEQSEEGS